MAQEGEIWCSGCEQPVRAGEEFLNAFGMQWHPYHLGCNSCGKDFSDGTNPEEGEDGYAYCSPCFLDVFAAKCVVCKKPILGEMVNALNNAYHVECFVCKTCKCSLGGGFYPDENGDAYCETHYYQMKGLLCAACEKPIFTGKLISFGPTQKYHPQHFKCTYCRKLLAGAQYYRNNDKPYCSTCNLQLFG